MEYPAFFARFYDTIYESLRNETDHHYFLDKILNAKGPVLEVGVGTGRLFIEALNKGADVYGIDISPAMIDIIKHKIPGDQQQRVQIQDVSQMNIDRKFSLIVAPFRVFMHLVKTEDQLLALEKVYQHLQQGGAFIFDLFVPNLKMLVEGLDNFTDFEGFYAPGKKLTRYSSMNVDPVNQISHITFRLVWDEDDGEHEAIWKTELRLFFRYELEHLLNLSNFTKFRIYGDFHESGLSSESREFVVVCEK
ncbi:MAG: class I SAM-dependent methyltransferase [Bacteroidales bacterium]|nr:class I SAM-dependent methyltransferase [Bacteroidales bacterium]